ncbi:sterol desaturase family protein [Hellea balneolensis]|uniref:sterol desaturase family protein n=1 Tax=Hellea balneolensis TaxID=287478 RepID=UPI00041C76AD|nr:sterol desaturase family protein [Hellea balneolensis]
MSETVLRLSIFAGALILFSTLEALFPRRQRNLPRQGRWLTHLGITVIDSLAVRILGPITAIATAIWAHQKGAGLFNFADWPIWFEITLAFILLDFAIYLQHVISHRVPLFWRLHKVHHTDRDLDASSAVRFHPAEIILSMIYKCGVVLIIGPAALAVLIFEICLNASAIFNHANLKLPLGLDKALRVFIVTPDMHRVHHSVIESETNKNFGFNFSIWDKLFGTYKAQPEAGHDGMIIGLSEHQSASPSQLWWSLKLPFAKTPK